MRLGPAINVPYGTPYRIAQRFKHRVDGWNAKSHSESVHNGTDVRSLRVYYGVRRLFFGAKKASGKYERMRSPIFWRSEARRLKTCLG
jgi:hypothetical protein